MPQDCKTNCAQPQVHEYQYGTYIHIGRIIACRAATLFAAGRDAREITQQCNPTPSPLLFR